MTELKIPTELIPADAPHVEREERAPEALPKVGEWFRTPTPPGSGRAELGPELLVCVTHVGSNYVEVQVAGMGRYSSWSWRVHVDDIAQELTPEPHAADIIKGRIAGHRTEVYRLMRAARELALTLGLTPRALAGGASATEQMALTLGTTVPAKEYKAALVKAQKETLPEYFKQIEAHNDAMASWMKAELIPLKAEVEGLQPAVKAIESRIFNVELYAGLLEEVVQVREGDPAPLPTQVTLLQRRHYMDEECLIQYESGGMEFEHIEDFDQWIARAEQFHRLLPFPRCVLAFKVRRRAKERDFPSLSAWIQFAFGGGEELDKLTFLYMRNGDQLFRLRTEIHFGSKLFPDLNATHFEGKLWARRDGSKIAEMVPDNEMQDRKREVTRLRKEWKAEQAALPKKERDTWEPYEIRHAQEAAQGVLWNPDTVYYDDITGHVNAQVEKHNRIALVLQGLLDRSPVFHPHPPWRLWTPEGFAEAIHLVLDEDRALTPGAKPDFEAYRARLNASLKVGSVTIGQDDYWAAREAVKYNAKDRRGRSLDYKRYRPYGDPGPGTFAQVLTLGRKTCGYRWEKKPEWSTIHKRRDSWRFRGDAEKGIPRSIEVPKTRLLNVDAYTPGDFKQFFADPRTRADYLQWAPYLLEAEEYHAGNRKLHTEGRGNEFES